MKKEDDVWTAMRKKQERYDMFWSVGFILISTFIGVCVITTTGVFLYVLYSLAFNKCAVLVCP